MKPKNNLSLINSIEESSSPTKEHLVRGLSFTHDYKHSSFYPYYFQKHLTKRQQDYYSSNGHSLFLKKLTIEVMSQPNICRELWEEFSPNQTLFDTWNFRLAFQKGYSRSPHFLVIKSGKETVALLPLWFEEEKGTYTWFGSTWQEENRFFVKDQILIPILLAVCPSPVLLNAISTELPSWCEKVIKLNPDDPKYILDLKKIKSVNDYLSTLKKKKRYNLKKDQRTIESRNPKVIFNRFSDFEKLVELSMKRFAEKGEDTDWEDPRRVETFRNVIKLGKEKNSYSIRMLTVTIEGKIASVDLIAIYKGCYYPLKCGYDVKSFPGIGNYVNLLEIEDATNLGMKKMDFLEIGYGWKDKWFEAIPLLTYEK